MRLFGRWYLCKNTGIPDDCPPRSREELVRRRLENDRLRKELFELKYPDPWDCFIATQNLARERIDAFKHERTGYQP